MKDRPCDGTRLGRHKAVRIPRPNIDASGFVSLSRNRRKLSVALRSFAGKCKVHRRIRYARSHRRGRREEPGRATGFCLAARHATATDFRSTVSLRFHATADTSGYCLGRNQR